MCVCGCGCGCVCVGVCVGGWVGGWVCVWVGGCVGVSVKYRRPNGWTDHDQIWHVYADRPGNGSYQKNGPTCGPEGWAHWDHSSKRVLSWRAASNPSRGTEPLAKQREEL